VSFDVIITPVIFKDYVLCLGFFLQFLFLFFFLSLYLALPLIVMHSREPGVAIEHVQC
jgi:hypothetical protein